MRQLKGSIAHSCHLTDKNYISTVWKYRQSVLGFCKSLYLDKNFVLIQRCTTEESYYTVAVSHLNFNFVINMWTIKPFILGSKHLLGR